MSRAKKLLEKINKNRDKISKNNTQINRLTNHPSVFNIIESSTTSTPTKNNTTSDKKDISILSEIDEFSCNSVSIERISYNQEHSDGDYGLEVVVPSGIITASGIGSSDEVQILEGELEGRTLEVVDIMDLTTIRLDDVSTYSQIENGIKIRFILNKE